MYNQTNQVIWERLINANARHNTKYALGRLGFAQK